MRLIICLGLMLCFACGRQETQQTDNSRVREFSTQRSNETYQELDGMLDKIKNSKEHLSNGTKKLGHLDERSVQGTSEVTRQPLLTAVFTAVVPLGPVVAASLGITDYLALGVKQIRGNHRVMQNAAADATKLLIQHDAKMTDSLHVAFDDIDGFAENKGSFDHLAALYQQQFNRSLTDHEWLVMKAKLVIALSRVTL